MDKAKRCHPILLKTIRPKQTINRRSYETVLIKQPFTNVLRRFIQSGHASENGSLSTDNKLLFLIAKGIKTIGFAVVAGIKTRFQSAPEGTLAKCNLLGPYTQNVLRDAILCRLTQTAQQFANGLSKHIN